MDGFHAISPSNQVTPGRQCNCGAEPWSRAAQTGEGLYEGSARRSTWANGSFSRLSRHTRCTDATGNEKLLCQAIAHAQRGDDAPRLRRILLYLGAQLTHEDPQILDLVAEARSPHLGEELPVRHDAAPFAQQNVEELELGWSELDGDMIDEDLARHVFMRTSPISSSRYSRLRGP